MQSYQTIEAEGGAGAVELGKAVIAACNEEARRIPLPLFSRLE